MTAVPAGNTQANPAKASAAAPASRHPWRAVISASIGNALEWFDTVVYGFFAVTIAKLFFPTHDETTSLLLTLGTFGVSFFMRPLGAIVIGVYADRRGRRAALTLSILLMMVGTFIIALLPTYESIGLLAPLGIVAARMIQGFSAGGEFGSATAFPPSTPRSGAASTPASGRQPGPHHTAGGRLRRPAHRHPHARADAKLGLARALPVRLAIGPVAYYIRRHVDETPSSCTAKAPRRRCATPSATRKNGCCWPWAWSSSPPCPPTGAVHAHLRRQAARPAALGRLRRHAGDRRGADAVLPAGRPLVRPYRPHPLMQLAAALLLATIWPVFWLLSTYPSFGMMLVVQIMLGLMMTLYFGALPALASEIFPVQTRTTGLSLSYNIAVTIFGGFAPFILTR